MIVIIKKTEAVEGGERVGPTAAAATAAIGDAAKTRRGDEATTQRPKTRSKPARSTSTSEWRVRTRV